MPVPKQRFIVNQGPTPAGGPSAEEKVGNYLQFIAHYLDRIDDHLELIAAAI